MGEKTECSLLLSAVNDTVLTEIERNESAVNSRDDTKAQKERLEREKRSVSHRHRERETQRETERGGVCVFVFILSVGCCCWGPPPAIPGR